MYSVVVPCRCDHAVAFVEGLFFGKRGRGIYLKNCMCLQIVIEANCFMVGRLLQDPRCQFHAAFPLTSHAKKIHYIQSSNETAKAQP